jgi:uncharacterized membrane protein (DUF485 family)
VTVKKRKVRVSSRYKAWREKYHLKPFISVLLYLIIPLVSIFLIMHQYPLLGKERFYRMVLWIVPFGSAMFCVTLVQERHPKGTKTRLALDALFVGLAMGWLFGFLGGRTVVENTYAGWRFSVDVAPVVAIGLVGTGLNFIHDVLEYLVHRTAADEMAPPVLTAARVARQKIVKSSGKKDSRILYRFE